ncbi:hypothetical protein C900_00837 [Fulvivirga imtechensis AK7]|uniref:ABC transporter permease n=1 Tax=Fulvivirga imtechensis AK7 TaxID=1237149 RepID=L8JV38_9BACT|nr:ABC transporter permease [Fulvivirga imtechensis]ELR72876.1 hypothetical protein C900_00837 [Fulvivirga imtechensis AK7]
MLKNYIKFAIRFLSRHKLYTLINLLGLTLGLASCLLIVSYVRQEMSFDNFHEHSGDIYRVNLMSKGQTEVRRASAISPPMGPALVDEIPEIMTSVRLRHADNVLVRIGEERFYEDHIFYVDSTFFDVFSFPLLAGDPTSVLDQKNSAVITNTLAEKYFAGEDPVGKTISIDNDLVVRITGVIGDAPAKSHLQFAMLISFSSFEVPHGYPVTLESWGWTSFPTYVRLHEGANTAGMTPKLHHFIASHMGEETAERIALDLQPVRDIHLRSKEITERDGTAPKGDITYVYGLLAIAILILGIAVFNFTNLSTTLSLKRIREIGVRKTLGAKRTVLFFQHITESLVLALGSLFLAVALLEIFSAPISNLLKNDMDMAVGVHLESLPLYLLLILIVGLAGGLYPALFLSGYSPTRALKGRLNVKTSSIPVKNVLVVFQFFITIGLIAASLVVSRQMKYLSERDLGFDQNRVIAVQMVGEELHGRYISTRDHLRQNPYVEEVTAAGNLFDGQNGGVPVQEVGNDESRNRISLFGAHYDFGRVMDLEFVAGRDFSEEFANDSSNFILNESAVKMLGWEDSPIGKKLLLNDTWEGEVIGVVRDFHYASMHEEITPLVLYVPRAYQDYIFIKAKAGSVSEILTSLERDWAEINPDMPFDYRFIDDHIQQLYRADQQFTALVNSFSVLAVFLACIGLYGMVSFHVEAKHKEIGIRKVLGASVRQVVGLLSGKFLVLVIIAAFLAIPLGWFLLEDWLTNFAYRIPLNAWSFIFALMLALVLAGITVALQTIRAAIANPVDALKEE